MIKIGQEIRKLWLLKHTLNIKTKYQDHICSRLHIVASISIIVHSKRLPWFRVFFFIADISNGIDVDGKTRT